MSFTDQKPWTVTDEDTKRPWSGHRDGSRFRCMLCGHRFVAGDLARWVYAWKPHNFFVCVKCDGPDVRERMAVIYDESKTRYWWLHESIRDLENEMHR